MLSQNFVPTKTKIQAVMAIGSIVSFISVQDQIGVQFGTVAEIVLRRYQIFMTSLNNLRWHKTCEYSMGK